MKKSLPLVELTISPDTGSFVSAIALVESPAIESDFIAFSSKTKQYFSSNDEKMELIGCAMIPDQAIYRNSPDLGEYAVTFSADTIRQIAQVYAAKGLFNQTNLEHTSTPADSYVFQSYITDESKGISAPKGIDVPDGSWIVGVKVNNPDVWSEIKEGKVKGFSVEGIFNLIDTNTTVNLHNQLKQSEFDIAVSEFEAALIALEEKSKA